MSYFFRDRRGYVYVLGDNNHQQLGLQDTDYVNNLTRLPLNSPTVKISRNGTWNHSEAYFISPQGSIQLSSSQEEVFLEDGDKVIHVVDVSYIQDLRLISGRTYRNEIVPIALSDEGHLIISSSSGQSSVMRLQGLPLIEKLAHDNGNDSSFYAIDVNGNPVSFQLSNDENGHHIKLNKIDIQVETSFKEAWISQRFSYWLDIDGHLYQAYLINGDQMYFSEIINLPVIQKLAVLESSRVTIFILDIDGRLSTLTHFHQRADIELVVDGVRDILANGDRLYILLDNGRILMCSLTTQVFPEHLEIQDVTSLLGDVDVIFDEDEKPILGLPRKSAR